MIAENNYKLVYNYEKHGHEVYFNEKPLQEFIDRLKEMGMRWHFVKKCWYGKATAEAIVAALGTDPENLPKPSGVVVNFNTESRSEAKAKQLADVLTSKPEDKYNLPDHWRKVWRAAGIKGVTVSKGRGGYTSHYSFTFRLLPGDVKPFDDCREELESTVLHEIGRVYSWLKDPDDGKEVFKDIFFTWDAEKQQRYIHKKAREEFDDAEKGGVSGSVCHYWQLKRESFPMFTDQFWDRWELVGRSVSCHNYDRSDSMTDYFDVGFYESWYISPAKEGAKADKEGANNIKSIMDVFRAKDAEAKRAEEEKRAEEDRKRHEEQEKKINEGYATVNFLVAEYPHIPGTPYVQIIWSEFMPLHSLSIEYAQEEKGAESMAEKISLEAFENITEHFCTLFKDRPGYEKTKFKVYDGDQNEVYMDRIDLGDGEKSAKHMFMTEIEYCEKKGVDEIVLNGGFCGKLEDIRKAYALFCEVPDMGAIMEEADQENQA